MACFDRMYYDFQDAFTESTHVSASSIICPKAALAVTIVPHCMCLLSSLPQRHRVGTITSRVLLVIAAAMTPCMERGARWDEPCSSGCDRSRTILGGTGPDEKFAGARGRAHADTVRPCVCAGGQASAANRAALQRPSNRSRAPLAGTSPGSVRDRP